MYLYVHISLTETIFRQKLIHEQAAPVVDKAEDSERGDVKGKHSLLTKELLEVRSKVQHLEKEMRALQKEILEAGNVEFLSCVLVNKWRSHDCALFCCKAGRMDFSMMAVTLTLS